MEIPTIKHGIVSKIDEYHENQKDEQRYHLGCSQVGKTCDREIWLKFRWAVQESFSGRIKRLFRRGQNEENTVVSDLRAVGVDVRETGRNQRRIDFGSHVSGSIDGVILSGVPEAPNKTHVLEIKTSSKKLFDDVEKSGVMVSKPEHYVQMQLYMLGTGIDRALYIVVCKDDDRMYAERVRFDKKFAEAAIERAKRIALSESIPAPLSTNATWYQCKMCACHEFCHVTKKTTQVNCRTCAHSTPLADSTWHCGVHNAIIPNDAQIAGCQAHVVHPDLLPWKLDQDKSTETTAAYDVNGSIVFNGMDGIDSKTFLYADNLEVINVASIFKGKIC